MPCLVDWHSMQGNSQASQASVKSMRRWEMSSSTFLAIHSARKPSTLVNIDLISTLN